MKTLEKLFSMLMFLFCMFALASCGEDGEPAENPGEIDYPIWDIWPYTIDIRVVDSNGRDLLDPNVEGSMADNAITATYKGKVYEKDALVGSDVKSRALPPTWRGLFTVPEGNGRYMLSFGEFDRTKAVEGEEIVIDWGDGSRQDVLVFSNSFWWENDTPQYAFSLSLNGVEQQPDSRSVTIVK